MSKPDTAAGEMGQKMKFQDQSTHEREQVCLANEFNIKYPQYVMVRYWRGVREGEPSGEGMTRTPAQIVSGQAVVWVRGNSGCISLSHIEVMPAASLPDEIKPKGEGD